jgi:hypothetical protein
MIEARRTVIALCVAFETCRCGRGASHATCDNGAAAEKHDVVEKDVVGQHYHGMRPIATAAKPLQDSMQ